MSTRLATETRIKIRLAAFVIAITVMVVLITWTAHVSWEKTGELREKLTSGQLQSFEIANHFQQTILKLNNLALRYGIAHETNDWAQFDTLSRELDRWIDDQRPMLSSEAEKHVLDEINDAYDVYMAAARQLERKVRSDAQSTGLSDFEGYEAQARNLLDLGFQLASAHRQSLDAFANASQKSLVYLRYLSLGSLALLMLAGGGLAVVVYRELIAPLKVKLVESQALVERQEKLASLGMLAAGIAHEVRNPLTAIKAWLFIQRKHLAPGSPEFVDAQVIEDEVSRLERLVKDFLLFARPSEPKLVEVPASEPLVRVQKLLSPQLAESKIQLNLQNSVPARIRIDPEQMNQVLINLVQNAAESIGENGAITLRVRGSGSRSPANGETVVLEVEDSGKGISPEVEKRLFDPFFTTKEGGTGLGLPIAARIVEKHRGVLQCRAHPNRGATFEIVLPRVPVSS